MLAWHASPATSRRLVAGRLEEGRSWIASSSGGLRSNRSGLICVLRSSLGASSGLAGAGRVRLPPSATQSAVAGGVPVEQLGLVDLHGPAPCGLCVPCACLNSATGSASVWLTPSAPGGMLRRHGWLPPAGGSALPSAWSIHAARQVDHLSGARTTRHLSEAGQLCPWPAPPTARPPGPGSMRCSASWSLSWSDRG